MITTPKLSGNPGQAPFTLGLVVAWALLTARVVPLAVRLLYRGAPLSVADQRVLAPVVAVLRPHGLGRPLIQIWARPGGLAPAVTAAGRSSVLANRSLIDAIRRGDLSLEHATRLIAHAAGLARSEVTRADPFLRFWTIPWVLLTRSMVALAGVRPSSVKTIHLCESRNGVGSLVRIRLCIYTSTRMLVVMTTTKVLEAITDPTRRRILDVVRGGERSVGELVEIVGMHQPGVSRHLKVLRDAGLVEARADANRRLYRLRPQPLQELDAWLEPYRIEWSNRLDSLERHLERTVGSRGTPTTEGTSS